MKRFYCYFISFFIVLSIHPVAAMLVNRKKKPVTSTTKFSKNKVELPIEKTELPIKKAEKIKLVTENIPGKIVETLKSKKYKHFVGASAWYTNAHIKHAAEGKQMTMKTKAWDPNWHIKAFLASEKNPALGSPGENKIVNTSANFSYNAYRNREVATITKNNKNFFMQTWRILQSLSPHKSDKETLTDTPEKPMTLDSRKYLLNESLAHFIIKLEKEGGSAIISSMNWNHKGLTDACCQAAKNKDVKLDVVVNDTALAGGRDLLQEMDNAGVSVHVTDSQMQHQKLSTFKRESENAQHKYLLFNSTANATDQGNTETNITSIFPYNKGLTKKAIKNQKQFIKNKCILFSEALQRDDERKLKAAAKKNKKRARDDVSDKLPVAKKQKTKNKKK